MYIDTWGFSSTFLIVVFMKISPSHIVSSSISITNPCGVTLGSPAFETVAIGNNLTVLNACLISLVKLTIVSSPIICKAVHSYVLEVDHLSPLLFNTNIHYLTTGQQTGGLQTLHGLGCPSSLASQGELKHIKFSGLIFLASGHPR